LALIKKKEKEIAKLERTKNIRAKRAKMLEEESQIAALAQESSENTQKNNVFNEEYLTSLMNKTMDTYFQKRQLEKTKRATIPVDPAQAQYYMPSQPPINPIQAPIQQPKFKRTDPRSKEYNPYLKMFNLE